jgi:hypothetical protein
VPYRLARVADAYRIAGDVKAGRLSLPKPLRRWSCRNTDGVALRFTACGVSCRCLSTPSRRGDVERALSAARLQSAPSSNCAPPSGPALALTGQAHRSRPARPDLQLVHRGFRRAGPEGREDAVGRVIMTAGSGRRFQFSNGWTITRFVAASRTAMGPSSPLGGV